SPTATTAVFTLGTTPVADNDPRTSARNVTNPTIDAAVRPVVSLGDVVWVDTDADGTYDSSERPLAGVTVRLLDAAGQPVRDANGAIVTATVTDANGRYSFEDLLPGEYRVVFVRPTGYAFTGPN